MSISEIGVHDLASLLANDAGRNEIRVIDVRELDEYTSGHVPGALHAPLSSLPEHVEMFTSDSVTYVICQAGGRSMRACEYLADLGKNVVNVAGGTGAWMAVGNDVVTGEQAR